MCNRMVGAPCGWTLKLMRRCGCQAVVCVGGLARRGRLDPGTITRSASRASAIATSVRSPGFAGALNSRRMLAGFLPISRASWAFEFVTLAEAVGFVDDRVDRFDLAAGSLGILAVREVLRVAGLPGCGRSQTRPTIESERASGAGPDGSGSWVGASWLI